MRDETNNLPAPGPANRDPATIARLLAGDPDGLQHLLEDHGGIVRSRLRHSFGRLLDDSELDEVMSVTAMRVWQASHRVDPTLGTLRAWLSVIGRNCALRFLEARRRSRSVEQHADIDQVAPAPDGAAPASIEQQGLVADMLTCLHQLPPLQRAVLLADLESGCTAGGEQLAARLHTSVNSIYVSRFKGRQSLRQALKDLGHRPDKMKNDGAQELGEQQG